MQAIRWFSPSWSSKAFGAVLVAASFGAASFSALAAEVDPDLASRVARDLGTQRYPVILHLSKQPDIAALARTVEKLPQGERGGRLLEKLKAFAQPLQSPLLKELADRQAEAVVPLFTTNAVAARLRARDVRELAQRSDIALLRFDIGLLAPARQMIGDPCHPARPTPRQRLPRTCNEDFRKAAAAKAAARAKAAAAQFDSKLMAGPVPEAMGAPVAWASGITGKGVTVAVIDTGVDALHPDLSTSFRGGAGDWFDVHGEQPMPMDRHGHGTQITGLMVGAGATGQTLGIAPQAKWIAARVYNDRNVARLSDLHRVMAWVLDPDGKPGTADAPQIVLNAWGLGDRPGTCDLEFATDLRVLRAAGMHVVFAAGNGGPMDNSSLSPANNSGALAVGALDNTGQMATFTSRGVSACDARPYPDLVAPGELLRTTDVSAAGVAITMAGTGTSYAAAVVSGMLALMVQARPKIDPAEREALLHNVAGDARPVLVRALGLGKGTDAGKPERQP